MSHFCRLLTAGQIDVHISCSRTENSCEHPLTFRCTRHSIGDGALCMDVPFPPPASFLPSFLSCSVCDVSFCCVRGVCSGAAAAGGGCHAVRCTAELQNHSTSDCDWHWEEKKNLNSCSPSPPRPRGWWCAHCTALTLLYRHSPGLAKGQFVHWSLRLHWQGQSSEQSPPSRAACCCNGQHQCGEWRRRKRRERREDEEDRGEAGEWAIAWRASYSGGDNRNGPRRGCSIGISLCWGRPPRGGRAGLGCGGVGSGEEEKE